MEKSDSEKKQPVIMLVEHEDALIKMYAAFFTRHGFKFLCTKDIEEAILLTKLEKPDIVLLSLILPKTDERTVSFTAERGFDYLEEIKTNQETKSIPIIIFTNFESEKDREKCLKMGVVDYILKSRILPQELLQKVRLILAEKSL